LVYTTTDWEHPAILELDPPIVLEPGQGLQTIVTYDNESDVTITFGFLSTDEMMILFGYYYLGVAESASDPRVQPAQFSLAQNYPNPFNPTTTIAFTLAKAGRVKVEVFDILGRETGGLLSAPTSVLQAGQHQIVFDGTGLASGIYFARLTSGGISQTRKMMLLK
jgi:hypothetical protein